MNNLALTLTEDTSGDMLDLKLAFNEYTLQHKSVSHKMSHITTKLVCAICEQQRHRSAFASMQSDQSLLFVPCTE